jgi:tetratricopeptide (TPR) repeat protein
VPRTGDWMAEVRERLAAHDLGNAQKIVDARLAAVPNDAEALGWRAQLLAWTGKRAQAEANYRKAIEISPRDADILLGLARLLAQEGRNREALALLNSAAQIPPARPDVLSLRGRVLAMMGRDKEARIDFLEARSIEPANISPSDDDASAGLRSLSEKPTRFELNFGNETDTFNYVGAANTQTVTFVARPSAHWILSAEADSYQRFGSLAQKAVGAATWRLNTSNSFTIAGGGGNGDGIIPRTETYFEYGHGFRVSETKPLRGIEFSYDQHWLWYAGAHVLVLTGAFAGDLERNFRWTISANGARSGFAGSPVAWEPSGYSKLEFPFPHVSGARLLVNATFAVGTENFGELDQVGAFASRTFGGGARVGITSRQYANLYVAKQFRNGGQTETMFGAGYGVRF